MPAIVEPELFAAVHEQLRDNQRHARQYRRGAIYLLQGLISAKGVGMRITARASAQGRKGKTRDYAYYRCLGTDAYRFGGARVCRNTQVRTDLLDLAVWRRSERCWSIPERLTEEYRRRLHPTRNAEAP